ncbi:MAG: alpha-amylase family glycosyl hydrolase [Chitinophagaceae bacterium]
MNNQSLLQQINTLLRKQHVDFVNSSNLFYTRLISHAASIQTLYHQLYGTHPLHDSSFESLIETIVHAHTKRSAALIQRDELKEEEGQWFLSNEIAGMSLYVDRFCENLQNLSEKLPYFEKLGVNLLHLMPLFESPEGESDGGYAVSNFRKVDERFGSLEDLQAIQQKLRSSNMYLMLDIVLNHTSHKHEWAQKAKEGSIEFQDYYYMYPNRTVPDRYEKNLPEIFPETAPGNFTFNVETGKWVMTVFHDYQWDLNYSNPAVFVSMLDTIFFYANLGTDILRIDAPAFIWKEVGTSCQNLPQAHTLLRLIKQCVLVATPGMALLGEAIVAPKEILKYFGSGVYTSKECDVAYNATHMALQWDALATGDTRVMLAAQHEILQKPFGTTWINYTRCHDDIGLGYDDYMIAHAGFNPFEHRRFLKDYYSGALENSPAIGSLFSVNPKNNDARISGSLASLCGLEKAILSNSKTDIELSIKKIILMQAHSFFIGGIPMLFYGDEVGYTNDYRYLNDLGKRYDNRWMHRPIIDWKKNDLIDKKNTTEYSIFSSTRRLIKIRKKNRVVADHKNIAWLNPHNIHVAGFLRTEENHKFYCIFNFSNKKVFLTWYAFKEHGSSPVTLYDHWTNQLMHVGHDHEHLIIPPYGFYLFEEK